MLSTKFESFFLPLGRCAASSEQKQTKQNHSKLFLTSSCFEECNENCTYSKTTLRMFSVLIKKKENKNANCYQGHPCFKNNGIVSVRVDSREGVDCLFCYIRLTRQFEQV
uniref:(northern house mosquito) hypothetical protein n=1 Tax=Culex pipiens TaxID=7175 RepID=A0A8D8GEN7_CULPI